MHATENGQFVHRSIPVAVCAVVRVPAAGRETPRLIFGLPPLSAPSWLLLLLLPPLSLLLLLLLLLMMMIIMILMIVTMPSLDPFRDVASDNRLLNETHEVVATD